MAGLKRAPHAKTDMEKIQNYQAHQAKLPGMNLPWLQERRSLALDRMERSGMAFERDETWKHLSLSAFSLPDRIEADHPALEAQIPELIASNGPLISFRDGQIHEISTGGLENGLTLLDFASALEKHPEQILEILKYVPTPEQGAANLVTALAGAGAFIDVPEGMVLGEPIQIQSLSTGKTTLNALHHFIRIRKGARATLIVHHAGPDEVRHLTLTNTTILLEEGASLDHYKLQREGNDCHHFEGICIEQSGDSGYHQLQVALGGRIARTDIHPILGDRAHCDLDGIFLAKDKMQLDTHTRIIHRGQQTKSRDAYRGIATGEGRGIFQGRIIVEAHARKALAEMQSRNLLLSEMAEIDARPELEIHHDDVQCAHGVTVGQLDDAHLFFLASRGIDPIEAKKILTFGFANEVLGKVRPEPLRKHAHILIEREIEKALMERDNI